MGRDKIGTLPVDAGWAHHQRSRKRFDVPPHRTLADLLRGEESLTALKVACGEGTCGACTVLIDDRAVLSCLTLAVACDGAVVRTLEGGGELLRAAAAGVHPKRRVPVWLLHPRPADVRGCPAGARPRSHSRSCARPHEREPLPLRRVCEHRGGCPGRGRGRTPDAAAGQDRGGDRGARRGALGAGRRRRYAGVEAGRAATGDRPRGHPHHRPGARHRHRPLHLRHQPAGDARGARVAQPPRQRPSWYRSIWTLPARFPECGA